MEKQQRRNSDRHLPLPQEIIDEILLRLPVKSLLRFRCVSKSWRALISSRRFIKAHLEKSSSDPSHHTVITSSHRLQRFPLASLLSEPLTEAVDIYFPAYEGFGSPTRSCNGLVCMKIHKKGFVLWNPSTRMYKNILSPFTVVKDDWIIAWGFGYVESRDDYRVFSLTNGYRNGVERCVAQLYSLNTDSWRMIDFHLDLGKPYHNDGTATYLGGKLYWLKKFKCRWEIVTFDLGNGEFGTRLGPPDTLKSWNVRSLRVLDGHLCVICEPKENLFKFDMDDMDLPPLKDLEIWVLKQNETPSWSKMMALPNPGEALSYIESYVLRMGNGEIVYCDGKKFAIYNPQGHMLEKLIVRNLGEFRFTNVHVGSLVSLGSNYEPLPGRKRRELSYDDEDDDSDDDDDEPTWN